MAIKSIKDVAKKKRPTENQIVKAKKAKAIDAKIRSIEIHQNRKEVSLGTHSKKDIAGVVKGFRQKTKANMGAILKDEDGNVIARTFVASGKSTLPEQLVMKALSKYGKSYENITIVMSIPPKGFKRSYKKNQAKRKRKK